MMKLTCVTAVFNAIKSGNRENLIRCVRSVAALKTEHEHLIYDGGSTDGTVELLRELEREVQVESPRVEGLDLVRVKSSSSRADGSSFSVDAFVSNASDGSGRSSIDAIETIASTGGGESRGGEFGGVIDTAIPDSNHLSSTSTSNFNSSHSNIQTFSNSNISSSINLQPQPILRIVSEPDTGVYNAHNRGVRVCIRPDCGLDGGLTQMLK